MNLFLPSEKETIALAKVCAKQITPPLLIGLSGDIGTGKTTFVRALFQALGVNGPIKSPSYTLIETYPLKQMTLHHIDFYRIENEHTLAHLGLRDLMTPTTIICVEWPDKAPSQWPTKDIEIHFSLQDNGRLVSFSPQTQSLVAYLEATQ